MWLLELYFLFLLIPSLSSESIQECSCADALNQEFLKIKNQLDEANVVIQNLIESNRKLRMELQISRKFQEESDRPSKGYLAPESTAPMTQIATEFGIEELAAAEIAINGWNEDVDESNEFVYGLPPSDPNHRRKIVIELGANNGEWIRGFLASNPDYWPLIVEPQPMYRDILREIAIEVAASRSHCRCGQSHRSPAPARPPTRARDSTEASTCRRRRGSRTRR
jgi:hypothetical protein